ncbi:MAG: Histidine kinase, partial [Myxococcaceae bacterium]|nr:Histidine kinase [Myxococcaceae bacterium]
EFLANMSHELRTPLNSVIGFADILYEGEVPPGSAEGREYIGDILKSGRHLLQLINDVLDLAKVESGKMEFRAEHVELPSVIGEVLDVLRSLAAANQISVKCELEPGTHALVLDPARLKQVLYNYLSNAFKFTPAGGNVIVRARISAGDQVTIEVEDSGAGIPAGDLCRLFVEFQQLDNGSTKRHAGTGLGLALTRRIVEAQGGLVGVRSEPGKGSTFWATLPMRGQIAPRDERLQVIEHGDKAATILVVEDDRDDQRLISATLSGAGFNVEIAETGKQAALACGERLFDAVTLDLLLPDRSGLQVLRELRSSGLNRDTPVIVLSVVAEQQVVHGFAVSDFLAKPVESDKILGSLQRAGIVPAKSGTILVVDDDLSSLKLMSATLRKLGYAADCQSDAALALARAPTQHHSAVILDLLMPGMDGFEFLWRFRAQPSSRNVPVIVWTTKDLTADDQRLLKRQAQAVFEKGGGRPMLLVEELNNLFRQHRSQPAEQP